jgi:hypothetical protein
MLDPIRHSFILGRHLAERRNVVSVSQDQGQATALCRQFAKMRCILRNITHAK